MEHFKGLGTIAREWRTQLFLRKVAHKNILTIGPTHITSWRPWTESAEFSYADAYETAINRNLSIFGSLPPELEIMRFTSTEDFNAYVKILHPQWRQKQKGDWVQGRTLDSNKIILIDYSALLTDTSITADHGDEDDFLRTNCRQILTHEVAHIATDRLVGNYRKKVPGWLGEGIAILTAPQKNKKTSSSTPGMSLKEYLGTLAGSTPTDEDLEKTGGGNKPKKYAYAVKFMQWIFLNKTMDEIPPSEKDIPDENKYDEKRIRLFVDVLRNIGTGKSFGDSFTQVFGLTYDEAYRQFYESLE